MPPALQFLVLTFAGWANRHQGDLIEYLREENRVLREHLGPRPLRLTDAQRRRLAVRGQKLGRRVLTQVAGIVTPDTILRWYRRLIGKKYDGRACRGRGRPKTRREVAVLVVRMAIDDDEESAEEVGLGVTYGSDVDRVKDVLHEAAQSVECVVHDPAPRVRFVEMGDSSLIFQVQSWIDEPAQRGNCIDGLNTAIYKALDQADIEIPFPQRVVHVAPPARQQLVESGPT